jgi:hypothetical protein
MNTRHILAALAVAGALVTASASPALAQGPRVRSGCSFSRGVLTCVTESTFKEVIGPFTTNGFVPASTTFDGITGAQICANFEGNALPFEQVNFDALVLDATFLRMTTTESHGLGNGKVFATSTSASLLSLDLGFPFGSGEFECVTGPPP